MSLDHSSLRQAFFVRDYDLSATLSSGQSFRWKPIEAAWVGVIGRRWVSLRSDGSSITATTAEAVSDWAWLTEYLQLNVNLTAVLRSFPDDEPMRDAVAACRGLRLLRQDPWECLASFILSSTKQIVQIQQIITLLTERFGEPLPVPAAHARAFAFPPPERLARCTEPDLRACKMGFRAPYLLEAARAIAGGQFDLARIRALPLDLARRKLMTLAGVGRKIADCVLLFAYGFSTAFPVDVWVMKALKELYFPRKRKMNLNHLHRFSDGHFGPHSGYAQQYLFHHARMKARKSGGSVNDR